MSGPIQTGAAPALEEVGRPSDVSTQSGSSQRRGPYGRSAQRGSVIEGSSRFGARQRPGTASTIGSNTSFASAADGSLTGSEQSASTATRLGAGLSNVATLKPSRSNTSSSSGTTTTGQRTGKTFEQLLASDETYKLSPDVGDTQDTMRDEPIEDAEPEEDVPPRYSSTRHRADNDQDDRLPANQAKTFFGGAGRGSTHLSAGQDRSSPRIPNTSYDAREAQNSPDSTGGRAPLSEQTPRLGQYQFAPASTSQTPTPKESAQTPARPPRNIERNPSTSTRASATSGRYATPPSGGASPIASAAELSAPSIPIHPLSGSAKANSSSAGIARNGATLTPTGKAKAATSRHNPTHIVSANESGSGNELNMLALSSLPPATGNSSAALSPTPSRTLNPTVPFPRSSSRGDPQSTARSPAATANTNPTAWSKAAFPISPSGSSVGLEQEVGLSSPDPSGSDKPGGTFLSQRLKKTSGFLRKLRGDKDPKTDAKNAANAVNLALPPLGLPVGPHASLRRRSSNSSFVSDGAASQAPSTKSVPTSRAEHARAATNYAEEPVPSLPAKWAQEQSTLGKTPGGFGSRMSKASKKEKTSPIGIGNPPLPLAKDAQARSGSAPLTSGGPSNAQLSANQRSASHNLAQQLPRLPNQSHKRKVDSNVGGSTSSGSEMRHTLKAWQTQMDETFADSARDLDTKTKIAAPLPSWTPSPVLPDLHGIDANTSRSGSFMGDEDETKHWSQPATLDGFDRRGNNKGSMSGVRTADAILGAVETPEGWARSPTSFKRSPNLPLGKRTAGNVSPGRGSFEVTGPNTTASAYALEPRPRNASAPGWTHEVDASLPSSPQILTTPADVEDDGVVDTQLRGHGKRSENVSTQSARSFETAVDPGSLFFRRADLQARANAAGTKDPPPPRSPLLDGAAAAAASSSPDPDESLDAEHSIRLVPQNEDYDEPTTPTETEPGAKGKKTHAREVSDLGPLPSSALTVASSQRRAGRASPSGTPASKLAALPAELASTKSPRRSASSSVSATAMDSTDPAVDIEAQAKRLAQACWEEDESIIKREKVAESLGGLGLVKSTARSLYMTNFDFTGLRVDDAFRKLCDKLFLRAETQQVDRILFAFSERFWACNPLPLYTSADVVHSLVFSLLLLNTDLHVADIVERMTRNQFVRNTLSAISESARNESFTSTSSHPNADDSRSSLNVTIDSSSGVGTPSDALGSSSLKRKPSKGGSSVKSAGFHAAATGSSHTVGAGGDSTSGKYPPSASGAAQSIGKKSSLEGNTAARSRAWEVELEGLLKEIYAAVKSDQIRLPTAESKDALSPMLTGAQRRTLRGGNTLTIGSERVSALKRGSIRGIQGLLGTSSSTLLRSEDNLSLTPSSFESRSFAESGLTPASSALSSPNSQFPVASAAVERATPLTLGFANTLSHSIVKEANDEDDATSDASLKDDELSDEELALMGPPWAKEGMLNRKHYWEGPQRRAKDKNWLEVFVVVQKGLFSVFRFGAVSGSTSKAATAVGGGNWLSNATPLGDFSLAHTLANALPPPGYNRARPHVLALTLPTGGVYFYQAGHEELVQEWVSTCNYWAARQSREPLGGAVGNMEYGWNKVLPKSQYDFDDEEDGERGTLDDEPRESMAQSVHGRPSHAGSLGSMDSLSVTQATPARLGSAPPDASIYSTLTASSRNQAAGSSASAVASDNRSIRSGRSGRSGRAKIGGSLFQNWTDAAASLAPGTANGSPGLSVKGTSGGSSVFSSAGTAGVHANERIYINDWKAPIAPTTQSTLKEEEQLEACLRRVATIEKELEEHNALREPMRLLYSPKGNNHAKALQNWQTKSQWLLAELTKFQVYVESLRAAAKLRAEKSAARAVESMMKRADAVNQTRPEEEGGPVPSSA
ncbi:Guanine nucleotide exchange factor [Ceraceosorus bombacis]|uniref:Guanine nucleotide exchange factor n=1 Tax=Ceraceosorus bombacis TaxID=401625 RepID=A0A0P1B9Q3_9BASI|nr:Guanine nucleotide exchange factor [Ceraceosorus bombacis]